RLFDGSYERCRRCNGQLSGGLRREGRAKQNGEPESLARRRNPFSAEAPAASCLFFSKHHGALADTIPSKPLDNIIRRGRFLKYLEFASNNAVLLQQREQIVGMENVRNFHKPIAMVRAGFNDVAKRAEFLDSSPDRGARDAEFVREVGAGNRIVSGGPECR